MMWWWAALLSVLAACGGASPPAPNPSAAHSATVATTNAVPTPGANDETSVPPAPTFRTEATATQSCEATPSTPFNPKNLEPVSSSEQPSQTVGDGMVRLNFAVTLPLERELVLRGGGPGEVRVRFEGASVRLGDGPRQPIYKVEKTKRLELVAWLLAEQVIVQIHDPSTGLEVVTLHHEGRAGEGGLSWTGKESPSVRQACATRRPLSADLSMLPRYFDAPADWAATSGARIVANAGSEFVTIETTSRGLEDAFCERVALRNLRVEAPWAFVDAEFASLPDALPVETEGRIRTDLTYKSPEMVERLLAELHRRFPDQTRLEVLGRTAQGRPILALAIANGLRANDPRPPVLLNGAYHGDEILSTEVVLDAAATLLYGDDPQVKNWKDQLVFWLVPMVNPDGVHEFLHRSQFSGRKNARDLNADGRIEKREGVDLNRNFPIRWGTLVHEDLLEPFGKWYRGPREASEAETRAMMALVDRERFVAAISYHTGTTAVLGAYSIDSLAWLEPDESEQMGQRVSAAMGRSPDGRRFRFRKNLYAVEGVDQDWMRHTHGTIAILVEVSRGNPLGWCARTAAVEPGRRAWQALADGLLDGHLVRVRATRGGAGIEVGMTWTEQKMHNGEAWRTRPYDGRAFRWLPADQVVLDVDGKRVNVNLPQPVEVHVEL